MNLGGDINVKIDLSNYAKKKNDLKNATGIDTSKLAIKADLVSLKAEIDKSDIEKLVPVPVDLSKLMQQKMIMLKRLCMINQLLK